jgi:hypothetical protein
MVEEKGRKEGEGVRPATNLWRPTMLGSIQPLLSSSTSSCSFYARSIDQKHQKEKIPFILFLSSIYLFYFLKILILYDPTIK